MNKLPTAAEVWEVLRQMGSMNIWTHDIHVMKNAQLVLLQFAEMLERMRGPFYLHSNGKRNDKSEYYTFWTHLPPEAE